MKQYKSSSLVGTIFMVLLACMLGGCGTPQNPDIGNNPASTSTSLTITSTSLTPTSIPLDPTSPIKAIRMLDHSKGWALTDQYILFTNDGGQNWKSVTPSNSTYGKYAYGNFMNDHYAWVVSTKQQFDNSVNVLRTSDGGQHWQSSSISIDHISVIDPPHFLTTQEGFLELSHGRAADIVAESVAIYHTTDGGQNWTKVSDSQQANGIPSRGHKTGISFKDAYNGWATGEDYTPRLYVTHDGGHTWSTQAQFIYQSEANSTAKLTFSITPPVFFGNTGFLPATAAGMFIANAAHPSNSMVIYKTVDGGATWTSIKPEHGFGNHSVSGWASDNLYIADVNHAWGTDGGGQVWGTSDGFQNWQLLNSQPTNNADRMDTLSFVDASYGWGISKTKLLHTTDGGKTWSEIAPHIVLEG